jgi:hypothetical protein
MVTYMVLVRRGRGPAGSRRAAATQMGMAPAPA